MGNTFYYSMLLVGLSGLYLSVQSPSRFLFQIALFTLYQAIAGRRAVKIRHKKALWYDWLSSCLGVLTGIWMISSLQLLGIIFGIIQLALATGDLLFMLRRVRKIEPKKNEYVIRHVGLMVGALIASTTAFVVVNVSLPQLYWLPWILPSVMLVPVIIYSSRRLAAR